MFVRRGSFPHLTPALSALRGGEGDERRRFLDIRL